MGVKRNLNGVLAVIGFGLFCYSFAVSTPTVLVGTAESMLAQAVGASASVSENPVNTYMKQLEEKEEQLDQREARIAYLEEREDAQKGAPATDPWALASFGTSIVLFGMVGLNFYFDRQRGRLVIQNPFSINLKQRG